MAKIHKIIELGIAKQVFDRYQECGNCKKIAEEFNLTYSQVRSFLHSIDKDTIKLASKRNEIVENNLKQTIDAHQSLINKINELENFIKQVKNEEGNVLPYYAREFLVAWKNSTDTLQWIIDRKIKLMEIKENKIFRDSIIEAIHEESPEVANRIREIIDEKRKELGDF
jgi:hypothetical protein